MLKTTIYMEPVPKGRARVTINRAGRPQVYTPKDTVDAERFIRYHCLQLSRSIVGSKVPLKMVATFYRSRPKSLAKKATMPVTRPDWDQYAKLLCDALQKFIYADDSQITSAYIKKRYGSPPRIELLIIEDEL